MKNIITATDTPKIGDKILMVFSSLTLDSSAVLSAGETSSVVFWEVLPELSTGTVPFVGKGVGSVVVTGDVSGHSSAP